MTSDQKPCLWRELAIGSAFAFSILAISSGDSFAQTRSGDAQTQVSVATITIDYVLSADELIGMEVYNEKDEEIATIEDLIVSRGDQVVMAVLSVGGFIGIGDQLIALPYDQLKIEGDKIILAGETEKSLKEKANFSYQGEVEEMQERYHRAAERELARWEQRIESGYSATKAETKDMSEEAKKALNTAWENVKKSYRDMKKTGRKNWNDAQKKFEQSMENLKKNWNDATK